MRRIHECKNTFYSNGNLQVLVRSSFDKNYNASVMKLKKSFIIVIPPGAQDPNLKKSASFFKLCHRDSEPLTKVNFNAVIVTFLVFFCFVIFYYFPVLLSNFLRFSDVFANFEIQDGGHLNMML